MTAPAEHPTAPSAVARWLGRAEYEPTWRAMQRYTETREADAADELWCLEHPPVYTLGLNGKPGHVLAAGDIPVVNIDRGGQVTYHGPGQLVVYPLLDLRRSRLGVRELVAALEDAIVAFAAGHGVTAASRRDAPGVYVDGRKLASLGLRIRRGCSYHGLALNVAMDLEPFLRINPCGYPGLEVVDMARLGATPTVRGAAMGLVPHLWRALRLPGAPAWAEAPRAPTYLPDGCARPDPAALDAFWSAARARVPELSDAAGYQVRWIGMDAASTNAIFEVIRRRDKTGTFTLHWIPQLTDQPVPQVGDCLVLIDYEGRPTLLVRLTGLHSTTFGAVGDADIAVDGSPVRDLAIWKPLHTRYWNWILAPFGREVADDMPFWVERFELLYDADPPAR